MQMKKGWKIFWTVIISLTGVGIVFCIVALCLGFSFSEFERAYPNGIGIIRKNYVSYDDDWFLDDDDEADDTEDIVSGEKFPAVENLKLDIGACKVRIKPGTDDKIYVDDSRMKKENAVEKKLSEDGKTLEITTKMRSSFKNMNKTTGTLVIYLPEEYRFEQMEMKYGAAAADIRGLNAKSLKINSGASGCTIKNADVEELNAETGAGSLDFYGKVAKDADINCGAGSVTLDLEGEETDYNYEVSNSVGSIEIGGDKVTDGLSTTNSIDNGRESTIRVSNSVGSVDIRFH